MGGKEAIYVQGEDLIARVTAQTCRQSGLSVVYTELLDFDGAEIYFKTEPGLAGRTYREVDLRLRRLHRDGPDARRRRGAAQSADGHHLRAAATR